MISENKELSLNKLLILATIAGMRSMMAPALLTLNLKEQNKTVLKEEGIGFIGLPATSRALAGLTTAELIGDKLPFTPSRLSKPQLRFRTMSGAAAGALTFKLAGHKAAEGAIAGGLIAIASSVIFFALRKGLAKSRILPEPLTGLVEDMVAFYLAGKYLGLNNSSVKEAKQKLLAELNEV